VHPAALFSGVAELLAQGGPEAEGTVADSQLRTFLQSPVLEIEHQVPPADLAFAIAVRHRDQLLGAVGQRAHDHEDAGPLILEPDIEVDAVGPPVDVAPVAQIPLVPLFILRLPALLQPSDRVGRQTGRIRAEDGFECLGEVAGADSLQVQGGDQRVQRGRPAHVGRQDRGREMPSIPTVVNPRLADFQTTRPGQNHALGLPTVPDDQTVAILVQLLAVAPHIVLDFGLQGLPQYALRSQARKLVQFQTEAFLRSTDLGHGCTVRHGRVLSRFLGGNSILGYAHSVRRPQLSTISPFGKRPT
jgi:hypothetical protein